MDRIWIHRAFSSPWPAAVAVLGFLLSAPTAQAQAPGQDTGEGPVALASLEPLAAVDEAVGATAPAASPGHGNEADLPGIDVEQATRDYRQLREVLEELIPGNDCVLRHTALVLGAERTAESL